MEALGFGGHSAVVICRFLRYQEALSYLVYAYQSNATLLTKGPRRGVKESVIALYRRKCLLVCLSITPQLSVACCLYHCPASQEEVSLQQVSHFPKLSRGA